VSGRLEGKVALVTGAARGIGLACAEAMAREGARVVLADVDETAGRESARRLGATFVACDVSKKPAVVAAVESAVAAHGRLDIAVANAGIVHAAEFLDLEEADFDRVLAVNLKGTFFGSAAAARVMREQRAGSIVNMSSANGVVGLAGLAPYTAAKHGVVGLTRSAALEFANKGVRVNAVGPGYVDTPRMRETPESVLSQFAAAHPMGRLAQRQEVARLVAFLLSDESAFCTGGFYPIDGGYTAQ